MAVMIIKNVKLSNFRCFEELEVSFHSKLTVLVAANGAGKTTVLDSVRIALWPYVKGFDLGSQGGKSATIQIDDVRLNKEKENMEPMTPAEIESSGYWFMEKNVRTWKTARVSVKKNTKAQSDKGTKSLISLSDKIQKDVRNNKGNDIHILPIVLYLGTGRLWYQGRYTSEVSIKTLNNDVFSRFWGYRNCLTATSNYKQFEEWFGWVFRSYRELQISKLESYEVDESSLDNFSSAIKVVQDSINELTFEATGWKDLQYRASQGQQLVMYHHENGYMPLELLSDGLRNVVSMIADIAFRCIKLNPSLGEQAALKTPGVVLIDEVDMFLHPSWQQRVIQALQRAFPEVQFIVTTHSPQVLTTVPSECVRILDGGKVFASPDGNQGAESSRLLKSIFSVDPRPASDPVSQLLMKYLKKIYHDKWDDADVNEIRMQLDKHFGGEEPALTAADLYIENRKWEISLEKDL